MSSTSLVCLEGELRDHVYILTLQRCPIIKRRCLGSPRHLQSAHLAYRADFKMLLLNKETKQEYEELLKRMRPTQKLTIHLDIHEWHATIDDDRVRGVKDDLGLAAIMADLPSLEVVLGSSKTDTYMSSLGFDTALLHTATEFSQAMAMLLNSPLQDINLVIRCQHHMWPQQPFVLPFVQCTRRLFGLGDDNDTLALPSGTQIKHVLVLDMTLYRMREYQHWGEDYYDELWYSLEGSYRNAVAFRGTPSQGPYNYHGFDLKIVEPEKAVDYHEFKAQVHEAWQSCERGEICPRAVERQLQDTASWDFDSFREDVPGSGPFLPVRCLDCSD